MQARHFALVVAATGAALLFQPFRSAVIHAADAKGDASSTLAGQVSSADEAKMEGVLVTALGSTAFGFSAQTWSQQYTSASQTAIIISLEPVFAAITSWVVAREHLGPRILLGAALIFVGILLAELKGTTPIAPESPEPEVRARAD